MKLQGAVTTSRSTTRFSNTLTTWRRRGKRSRLRREEEEEDEGRATFLLVSARTVTASSGALQAWTVASSRHRKVSYWWVLGGEELVRVARGYLMFLRLLTVRPRWRRLGRCTMYSSRWQLLSTSTSSRVRLARAQRGAQGVARQRSRIRSNIT